MKHAIPGLDLGDGASAGLGVALLWHEHVFTRLVDPHELLEHVAAPREQLHILFFVRLPRQRRPGQRMLQLNRTRQPQFEERFREGGSGHWPRYRPRLISANVQMFGKG